jgi:hypothetical protein
MWKAILTTRPVWILLLMAAAVTGGPGTRNAESVKYWKQYGESRLHKTLSREVHKEMTEIK